MKNANTLTQLLRIMYEAMRSGNNSGGMKYYKRRRPTIVVSILSIPRHSGLPTQH